ncbi:Omp28-related outer membrane protein [Flavobacterium sp.]|uniref:Omp28-related outer membrane protein n=1 Tax=Flavobacterium sp. TaxID=239 RepID=UPI003526E2CA
MKKKIFYFVLLLGVIFTSCSSDDNSSSDDSTPADYNIILTADANSKFVDDVFVFTIKKSDGTDITSQASIKVDGVAIDGNEFSSSSEGDFSVVATYLDKTSNTVTLAVTPPATSITASTNSNTYNINSNVTVVVTSNTGVNVSQNSTVYVNGNAIEGNSFSPPTEGVYDIYATYINQIGQTLTSPTIQITAIPVIDFNKRVLIEDFTGTWCGYCPRVAYAIEQVQSQTSDVTVVAIHRGDSNPSNAYYDPYNFSGAGVLENQIGLSGYPTAMLNRTIEWNYPEPTWVSQATGLTSGTNPRLGIAFENTTSGNTSTVKVKVKFGQDYSNLKLVVYALEDNLYFNQTNYTSYYGGVSTITNFEHDHVLRSVLTSSILGEDIPGSFSYNDVYEKTFTYTAPSGVAISNVTFAALVINSSNTALNSRNAANSETQVFEEE